MNQRALQEARVMMICRHAAAAQGVTLRVPLSTPRHADDCWSEARYRRASRACSSAVATSVVLCASGAFMAQKALCRSGA